MCPHSCKYYESWMLLCGAALLCAIPFPAHSAALSECHTHAASHLKSVITAMRSYEAQFTQRSNKPENKVQAGEFSFKQPRHFRWIVHKPQSESWLSDGRNIWHYEPDLSQVTVRDWQHTEAVGPLLLLSEDPEKWIKRYRISCRKDGQSAWWFTLLPYEKTEHVRSIQLRFATGTACLPGRPCLWTDFLFGDGAGQSLAIRFSEVSYNMPIPEERFVFRPPPNTDIVQAS